jgi:hypothetical protein
MRLCLEGFPPSNGALRMNPRNRAISARQMRSASPGATKTSCHNWRLRCTPVTCTVAQIEVKETYTVMTNEEALWNVGILSECKHFLLLVT